jgi:predicted nucleotidyltransferase
MTDLLREILPPVRAEALRLLFGANGRELHLRELCRLSKLGLGPWQRELAKLERLDLVRSRKDGNRRAFRSNQEHPLFAELTSLVAKTSGLRGILTDALKDLEGIQTAFVFGSLATGSGKAASDVDLFVIGTIGLRAIAPRLRPATDAIGREINPVVMSAASFSSKLQSGDAFLKNVMAAPKLLIVGDPDELAAMG